MPAFPAFRVTHAMSYKGGGRVVPFAGIASAAEAK